jgi:hypothetical protein
LLDSPGGAALDAPGFRVFGPLVIYHLRGLRR